MYPYYLCIYFFNVFMCIAFQVLRALDSSVRNMKGGGVRVRGLQRLLALTGLCVCTRVGARDGERD